MSREKKKQLWKEKDELDIFITNPEEIHPLKKYLGCHSYGIKCGHIPENEIWISNELKIEEKNRVMDHEIIEREIMKDLEKNKGYSREKAYQIGHFFAEAYETYEKSNKLDESDLKEVFNKINLFFSDLSRNDVEKWVEAIRKRGYKIDERTKRKLLSSLE